MAEIREELAISKARKAAQDRLEKAISEIKREVEIYGRESRRSDAANLKPLDLESFASQRGLTVGKTRMVDALEVQEYELGKSFEQAQFSWPPQQVPFAAIAFRDGEALYRPAQIRGESRDVYFVYWKVREKEAYVPALKDIRDKVIDTWKQQEAFKVAKTEAEQLAGQAKSSAKPLKEIIAGKADLKVTETNEFSWLSTGFTPAGMGMPGLSSVEGVTDAGEDFMRAVFALKLSESGVAVNEPKSFVYVVRIISDAPSDEELKKQFLESGGSFEIQQIASMEGQRRLRDWYLDLTKQMGVSWKRPAESQQQLR